MKKKEKYIIGIDEVGRGPLAGPVTLCFVRVSQKDAKKIYKLCAQIGVTDSKKLSEKKREAIVKIVKEWKKEGLIQYICNSGSNTHIDRYGIAKTIKKSLKNGLKKLQNKSDQFIEPYQCEVLLDGSLYAPDVYKNQKTIIKGDLKEPLIALASIIAKVHRDALMDRYSVVYPQYGFEKHKGYGTKIHREAIKEYGTCPIHRISWIQ